MNSNKNGDFEFVEDGCSGETYRFVMKGRVSVKETAHMEHKLERVIELGGRHIVINMCFVDFFSSAGIRVILHMYKKVTSMGGSLKIENPSENVRNVIGLVALNELLLK